MISTYTADDTELHPRNHLPREPTGCRKKPCLLELSVAGSASCMYIKCMHIHETTSFGAGSGFVPHAVKPVARLFHFFASAGTANGARVLSFRSSTACPI
jgi:hypothetical protein